jgi:hypothetical protein
VKKQIKQFIAFVIAILGMSAMICLSAATANKLLSIGQYIFWMIVATIVLQINSKCIEKYIVNGEWV